MSKKGKKKLLIPASTGIHEEEIDVLSLADFYLEEIASHSEAIKALQDKARIAVEEIEQKYAAFLQPNRLRLEAAVKALKQTMKCEKSVLFPEGKDIVHLAHGTLIHESGDHVTIPRDALEKCKAQGFLDVIKTVESLDREAIEKWPDEKLFLIGAERKPQEKFEYEIKENARD